MSFLALSLSIFFLLYTGDTCKASMDGACSPKVDDAPGCLKKTITHHN